MRVVKSAEILNYYLNHSKIYAEFAPDNAPEYLDSSDVLGRPDSHMFVFDGGCLIFFGVGDNVFEGDMYFIPRKRGANAKQSANEALKYMFEVVGADKIVVKAPLCNRSSMQIIGSLGFERCGLTAGAFMRLGVNYDIVHYELSGERWAELSMR